MATVKSEILKQLKKSYPNFYTKDLSLLVSAILKEIKNALKRGERVELRNSIGVFFTKTQKKSIRRNPKTGEKVHVNEKRTIRYKPAQEVLNKINDK